MEDLVRSMRPDPVQHLGSRAGSGRTFWWEGAEELAQGVGIGVPPTDAERVSCGVGEDEVARVVGKITVGEQRTGAESCRLGKRGCRVVDVEVEVDLL